MGSAQQIPLLQVKATVRGPKPPIWRRLLIPSNTRLSKVHLVIQAIMGWESIDYDYHLHEFVSGKRHYGNPEHGMGAKNEKTIEIGNVLTADNPRLLYRYDFGCDWEVDIVLEKSLPPDSEHTSPKCLAGKRAGPPEDMTPRKGYDPAAFDLNAINRAIEEACS